jgi:hypothetical protein
VHYRFNGNKYRLSCIATYLRQQSYYLSP